MTNLLNQTQNLNPEDNATDGDYFTPYTAGISEIKDKNGFINYDAKFNLVSDLIKKIIFDFSTAEFIEEKLGIKFNLEKAQKKEIAKLIREILLGNIFIGDFTKTIQTKLSLDENRSKDIASAIVTDLFPTALESIKAVQRTKFPERIAQIKSDTQTPSPITPPTQFTRPPIQTNPAPIQRPQFSQPQAPTQRPPFNPPPPIPKPVNKPLEDALEKVANIIDLRNKPRE